jgi:hypothetical protein
LLIFSFNSLRKLVLSIAANLVLTYYKFQLSRIVLFNYKYKKDVVLEIWIYKDLLLYISIIYILKNDFCKFVSIIEIELPILFLTCNKTSLYCLNIFFLLPGHKWRYKIMQSPIKCLITSIRTIPSASISAARARINPGSKDIYCLNNKYYIIIKSILLHGGNHN